MIRRRRVRAVCLVALIASTWLVVDGFVTGTRADAHAVIENASPSDGELLEESPEEVVITFTEPPDPELSTLRVLDSAGSSVTAGATRVDTKRLEMRAEVEELPDGVYTVAWRAVSQADGHVTAGSYSFGVGVDPPSGRAKTEVVTSSPSAVSVMARSSLYWGLALLVAAGTLGAWMLGAASVSRVAIGLAWILAAAGICVMIAAEANTVGVSIGSIVTTATGRPLVQQAIGVGIAGIGTALYLLRRKPIGLWLASGAAVATMFLHASAGHAGAARSWRWFDVGVQFVHILATGLWVGGLVWLAVSIRRLDGEARARAITRFSVLAGFNLAVIVATGVARELDELGGFGNLDALLNTSFGVALLIKTGLFVGLVFFAARNRFAHVPKLETDPTKARSVGRTVAAELAVAVAVFGVTGALSQLPPPATAQEAGRSAANEVVVTGNDFATTVKAELTITPGTVGPNRFRLEVRDFDTGEPVEVSRVELLFSFPDRPELASALELEEEAPGVWTADGTQLSLQGLWDVDALIESAGDSVEVALEVRTRRPPQDVQVTRQEGQPTLYTIQLGGGSSVQTYVDPGKAGVNNVHFTFFDDQGGELAVQDLTATATAPDGDVVELDTRRFSAGHYVSNAELDAGRWEFDFAGKADGRPVAAYFAHTIEP